MTPVPPSVSAGRWAAANEALGRAESLFQTLEHEVGLYHAALLRAECLLRSGDAQAAVGVLEPLAQCAVVQQRPVFRADWLVACVEAHAALPAGNQLSRLRAEHDALYRRLPSVERNFSVHRAVAVGAAARGDWHTAEPDFRKALDAAQQMHDSLPNDADRLHFLECQQPGLLMPACDCLRLLGKGVEADRVASRFRPQSACSPQPPVGEAVDQILGRRRLNRRRLLLGLLLGVFNLVAGFVCVVTASAEEVLRELARGTDPFVEDLTGIAAMLWLSALVVLVMGGFWFVAGLIFPSLHNRYGWILPLTAIAPWLLAAMVLAVRAASGGY